MTITTNRTRHDKERQKTKVFLDACRRIGGWSDSTRRVERYQAPDGSIWEEHISHPDMPQVHYRLILLAR